MAYSPPTTFTTATALTSSALQGNTDELRIYLHNNIANADLEATRWIDTRHIQPPVYEPYSAVQHGVSGHQGGQWGGGSLARLSFSTSYMSGNGIAGAVPNEWQLLPNTSFKVDIRRAAHVLYHWYIDVEAGPDDIPYTAGRNYPVVDRLSYFAPYVGNVSAKKPDRAQPVGNHREGWKGTAPIGATRSYTVCAGYGQRDGTLYEAASVGTKTVGLCSYSQVDRTGVINWGVAIEVFYL